MEEYWTVSTGVAVRNGWSCRECKDAIMKGEPCYVRDGRKLRLFYHERCFSGTAGPRTQTHSSFQKWRSTISDHAPAWKGRGKWSVSSYGYEGSHVSNHQVGRKNDSQKAGATPRTTALRKELAERGEGDELQKPAAVTPGLSTSSREINTTTSHNKKAP